MQEKRERESKREGEKIYISEHEHVVCSIFRSMVMVSLTRRHNYSTLQELDVVVRVQGQRWDKLGSCREAKKICLPHSPEDWLLHAPSKRSPPPPPSNWDTESQNLVTQYRHCVIGGQRGKLIDLEKVKSANWNRCSFFLRSFFFLKKEFSTVL